MPAAGCPGIAFERVEHVRYGFSPRFCLAFCCRRRRPWSCRLLGQQDVRSRRLRCRFSAKSSSKKKAVELQVFAANSLEKALPEVQELYAEQTGTTFADTQFKASGDLVEQMRAGAAVDVLITASKGTMDDAEAAELVDADTREDMFVNDLVIIRAEGSDTKVEAIADVANLDGKIAIGDAKTVPAGKYANQALASVGLYTGTEGDDGEYAPEIADKVALADKVGTAAALRLYRRLRGRFCLQLRYLPLRRHRGGLRVPRGFAQAHRVPGCRCRELRARRRGQGVYRLLPDQQESSEDLG